MKIGRNDKCPCGSGKKYKSCCLKATELTQSGGKYSAYAVISGGNKYHSSFVLEDSDESQELGMRDYNRKLLNKEDVEVIEYFSTHSMKLVKDVVNGLHNMMLDSTKVVLIDSSDSYQLELVERITEAQDTLRKKAKLLMDSNTIK